jgi:DNA-binding transcriptional LysR family regulator
MLDPKLLATFREVAVRGSFSAAADELSFTQPAVSQHIARLEKDLGTRLLERDARAVTLTPAGETLLRHADSLLEAMRRARVEVQAAAGQGRPCVRVGAFPTAASSLIPGAARELRSRNPGVDLQLQVLEPDDAEDALLAGSLDVGMGLESDVRPVVERIGLEHILIGEDPFVVALPPDHRLAGRSSIRLEDLCDDPWISPGTGHCADSDIVARAWLSAGFEADVRVSLEDYDAVLGLVEAGVGVALVPTLALVSRRGDVVIRPIHGRPPARRILAAMRAGERDPLVDRFVESLRMAAQRLLVTADLARVA